MSEFGKGFIYPLALFIAHDGMLRYHIELYERLRKETKCREGLFTEDSACDIWINGASDHLYEFLPECGPNEDINTRAKALQDNVLSNRFASGLTVKKCKAMLDEAKSIMLAVDIHTGVAAEKADYE